MKNFKKMQDIQSVCKQNNQHGHAESRTDEELYAVLHEIDKTNCAYLFERCKTYNVDARQLPYLTASHIAILIPFFQLGIRVEFEHLLKEWVSKCRVEEKLLGCEWAKETWNGSVKSSIKTKMQDASTMTVSKTWECRGTNTEPPTTERPTTERPTTEPPTIKPPTTAPPTTERPTKEPPTIKPPTIEPPTIEPPTTAPPTTAPPTTEPPTTEPPTAVPKSHVTENAEQSNGKARESGVDLTFVDCIKHTPAVSTTHCSEQYFLGDILPDCLAVCQRNYKENGNLLREADRQQLTRAMIDYLASSKIRFNFRIAEQLANQITKHFPTERKRLWYARFYNLCYKHRADRMKAKPHHIAMEDNDAKPSSTTNCETVSQVFDMWKDSWPNRCEQIKRLRPGRVQELDNLLAAWLNYRSAHGTQLLAYDFEQLYPHKIVLFKERWQIFITSIGDFLENQVKLVPILNLSNHIKQHYRNNVGRECFLVHLMHIITVPSRYYTSPELQSLWQQHFTESEHATMRLVANEYTLRMYNGLHPCIFMVGRKMSEITQCVVVWRNWRFRLPIGEALLAVLQIYLVFKLEIPPACRNFWQFVRDSLCDIQLPDDISCTQLDNVKKYILYKQFRKEESKAVHHEIDIKYI